MAIFGSPKILGIDIGSFTIKLVELSRSGERFRLENYGQLESQYLYEQPFRSFEKNVLTLSSQEIAESLQVIVSEAKISTKAANFSLPDFASFFTTFALPKMSQDELSQAVMFEARQHVPLPIDEMALDWVSAVQQSEQSQAQPLVKILLVAIPKKIVAQYQEIAQLAKFDLKSLEAEVFSLARSLLAQDQGITALLDIGAQSTTLSIVEQGSVQISHSFDLAGNFLTQTLMDEAGLEMSAAENLKTKFGLLPEGKAVKEILQSALQSIIIEVERIFQHFSETERKSISRVVLAGGTANLKGLPEFLSQRLRKPVKVASAFNQLSYPSTLQTVVRSLGPSFAVAAGVALGGLR